MITNHVGLAMLRRRALWEFIEPKEDCQSRAKMGTERKPKRRLTLSTRRLSPSDGRCQGTLAQFVRNFLCRAGGTCSRVQLLTAIQDDPVMTLKLRTPRSFDQLLRNMQYAGDIKLHQAIVVATARTVARAPKNAVGFEAEDQQVSVVRECHSSDGKQIPAAD